MSMPEIPSLDPVITIKRDDALNMLLASNGIQELGIAHLINAEAEKMQFALGTLETSQGAATIEEILEVSKSSRAMMKNIFRSQMLLTMNLEDLIQAIMNGV